MSDIIETLKNAPEYIGGTGRTAAEIEIVEKQLGVEFAPDYRCYLKEIGLACFNGHELTGICKSTRLNVTDVTLAQRKLCPETHYLYVIEEANIDGIVIWQASTGEIYQSISGSSPQKKYSSLVDYVLEEL